MTVADLRAILLPDGPQDEADALIHEVLEQCRLALDTEEDVLRDALATGPWRLRSVSVSGFRGAANGSGLPGASLDPLVLDLPRSVDVVVLHASNGVGKSTIADALDVALSGNTARATAFSGNDARMPFAVHADSRRSVVSVGLDNERNDRLITTWRMTDGAEQSEVLWQPFGDPHGVTELPGESWAATVAARHPVVGYDHLAHSLRTGRLTEFLHNTLSLGGVWWTLWELLSSERDDAAAALRRWTRVRDNVVTALAELDEDLADQHPEVRRPAPLSVPDTPFTDISEWFAGTFSAHRTDLLTLNVDRRLEYQVSIAREAARDSVQRYKAARDRGDEVLWAGDGLAALTELVKHTKDKHGNRCPVCGETADAWRDHADRTLQELRLVREEFNLALVDLTELAKLLVDRTLPLLRSGELISEIAVRSSRLRAMVEPLVGSRPGSDQDSAWVALTVIANDPDFDRDLASVLTTLASASDALGHWQAARRRCCADLVAAQSRYGRSARRIEGLRTALDRIAKAFDETHEGRRAVVELEVDGPLRTLLADVDVGGVAIEVDASSDQGLNESATLRLALDGRDGGLGVLSAGQYNALVLALLLGAESSGPFRFQVLDDPVHAFDEFRTDVFAELIALKAATGKQFVLLTHDEQLVEVLRRHVARICVVKLGRDQHGNITQVDATHPWEALIADAWKLLQDNTNKNTQVHTTLSPTTASMLILAFCRQAVDAALREFVLETNRGSSELAEAVEKLERAKMTKKSLETARRLVAEDHPARALIATLLADSAYLAELNAASHGDPSSLNTDHARLTARIGQTEQFCSALLGTVNP
ncbi:hypothetical protein ACSHWB_23200 [Lentzea sp. HUAS TT2]|uniref:hypothetical protein n=1 Tax=Lentzea sp. HUAS TT2 TaxID=3447454 RepID=UPI003F6FA5E4